MMRGALREAGTTYWLRDARLPAALTDAGGEGLLRRDVRVEHGRIAALAPAGTAPDGVSLDGGQLWPGFVDAHTHLDKGHIWPRSPNPDGDFAGAIAAVGADRAAAWTEADMRSRAEFAMQSALAHGTVAIRTHLDSYLPHARVTWPLFAQLRAEWAGRIDLQLVSIAPLDRFAGADGVELADLVARHGGVLGMVTRLEGHVHDALQADFQPMLDHFFSLAEARGLALDLHVDESGDSGARALREIALTALRRGFRAPIQCGHCCSLAVQPDDFAAETIARVAEAGIRIIVLPMCNMYLQGRAADRTPRWRGVTLVHELAAAGVPVSFASDNTRDPFYAYGDLDMVEVFRESTRILQLDHPIAAWPRAVTAAPAAAMGLADRGVLRVGAPADLVAFRARGWSELLSRPQADRVVIRGGRVLDAEVPDYRALDGLLGVPG